jgi:hypothetical protein
MWLNNNKNNNNILDYLYLTRNIGWVKSIFIHVIGWSTITSQIQSTFYRCKLYFLLVLKS